MISPKNFRKNQVRLHQDKGANLFANALRKQNVFKTGFVSALVLIGAISVNPADAYAQQSSQIQTAVSPWTGQNGREIVDLNEQKPVAKKSSVKKSNVKQVNHIRQTQASIPQEDLLGEPLIPMSNPEFDNAPLEDPSMVPNPLDSESITVDEDSIESFETVPASPTTPNVAPKRLQATTSEPVKDYPRGEVANVIRSTPAQSTPAYSTNPYSRIGQAEYNPRLFYGTGSPNASVNGYRNTVPEVAYGQSLCGGACGQGCNDGVICGFLDNTQLSTGLDAMRSPLDFEDNGNVGGNFAVNWGSARPVFGGLHLQAGVRGVFTDLQGEEANGFETDDCRSQLFWTVGAYFRSNQYSADGLSFGVVYDSLREDYYRRYDLQQLRTELSYTFGGTCAVGFRGAFGLNEDWCDFLKLDDELTIEAKATTTDYYTAFIRKSFEQGGEGMFFGGATKWGEGIIGGSVEAPISESFALKCSGSVVFPKVRDTLTKREECAWNMSMGLVWYLGGGARNTAVTPRPLFDVADNGSFLQNFVR